jgi:hypothetical protein
VCILGLRHGIQKKATEVGLKIGRGLTLWIIFSLFSVLFLPWELYIGIPWLKREMLIHVSLPQPPLKQPLTPGKKEV